MHAEQPSAADILKVLDVQITQVFIHAILP